MAIMQKEIKMAEFTFTSRKKLQRKFVLPPFQNIRCFSFVKLMYLDIF
jgi:hypothetical protein